MGKCRSVFMVFCCCLVGPLSAATQSAALQKKSSHPAVNVVAAPGNLASAWSVATSAHGIAAVGMSSHVLVRTGESFEPVSLGVGAKAFAAGFMADGTLIAAGMVQDESSPPRGAVWQISTKGVVSELHSSGKGFFGLDIAEGGPIFVVGSGGHVVTLSTSGKALVRDVEPKTKPRLWAVLSLSPSEALVGGGETPWQDNGKSSGTILRTVDGGVSWTIAGTSEFRVADFAETRNKSLVAAGVGGSLLRSEDRGATWTPAGSIAEWNDSIINAIEPFGHDCLLAASGGGELATSPDGGRSWMLVPALKFESFVEDIATVDVNTLVLAIGDGSVVEVALDEDHCAVSSR